MKKIKTPLKSIHNRIKTKFFNYFSENLKFNIQLTYTTLTLSDIFNIIDSSKLIILIDDSIRMMERKYNYFSDMVCLSTKEYEKLYYFTNKYIKTFHTDFNLSKEILFSI